jgi:protein gp37
VHAENQQRLNERWEHLKRIPACVLGLSLEPLLSEMDLTRVFKEKPTESELWIIAGGESGFRPRPTPIEVFRGIRDQTVKNGGRFFFKQWGVTFDKNGKRISKRNSGRELDGKEWNETPEGK